jgi:hypothetical protein
MNSSGGFLSFLGYYELLVLFLGISTWSLGFDNLLELGVDPSWPKEFLEAE